MVFMPFSKSISPKVNVTPSLEFELASYDIVVQHFSDDADFIQTFILRIFERLQNEMVRTNRVQIMDKAFCIPLPVYVLGKGINPSLPGYDEIIGQT